MWQLTSWYSETYDIDGLFNRLKSLFAANERQLDPRKRKIPLPEGLKERSGFHFTTRHKLLHDLEQFEYLVKNDKVGMPPDTVELLSSELPRIYRSALESIDMADLDEENEFYQFQSRDAEINAWYNRALFVPEFGPVVKDEAGYDVPLLNPNQDWDLIERQWYGEEAAYKHPGIVIVDNVLSPQVLEKVRDYLLMSTVWYDMKTPRYGQYVGAYIGDGLYSKLLMAIAFELHKAKMRIMNGHAMKELWSYKYESSPENHHEPRTGIHTHADDAAVNVNIWITPDSANLDPYSGGLVIFTAKPPLHWGFDEFNSNWEFVEEQILKPTNFAMSQSHTGRTEQ